MEMMSDEKLAVLVKRRALRAEINQRLAALEPSGKNIVTMSLPSFIRKLRKSGMTDSDIREYVKCTRNTLRNWEFGIAVPVGRSATAPVPRARVCEFARSARPTFATHRQKARPNTASRERFMVLAKERFKGLVKIDWEA